MQLCTPYVLLIPLGTADCRMRCLRRGPLPHKPFPPGSALKPPLAKGRGLSSVLLRRSERCEMGRAAQTVEAVEGRRKRRSPDTQRTPAESICIVGGCKAENRQYVETGGNCSVRRGYYGSGVRWMQKSLCSPQTMPADRSGLGRIWQEDAASGRAFEMDAAATFSDPPASQAGGIHARTPVAGIVLMPTRRLRPL